MAFTPREFNQILTEMIAYVRTNTIVSDFSVGSVARTILESAALEDDEQYFQMVQLLDAFSILTSEGSDLDLRVKDFNIFRQPAKSAFGRVTFFDDNLTSDQVALDAPAGSTVLTLFATEGFPIPTPSYVIRVAEGTTKEQDLEVIGLNSAGNQLTLSAPTTIDFVIGDSIAVLTGAVGKTVGAGENVQSPPTTTQFARTYVTQEAAFIEPGNRFSNTVQVKSVDVGVNGNVGAGRITTFTGGLPFSGAGVTNITAIEGGVDEESDAALRVRALRKIQALSRGTPLSLKEESIGVEDPATGQRVVSSNILESLVDDEVLVYIDDGSGLNPDRVNFPEDALDGAAGIGVGTITLDDASDWPSSGFLFIETGLDSEIVEYDLKTGNTLELSTPLVNAHLDGDIVFFIDVVSLAAETGQRRFRLQNIPVIRNSERIFVKPPAAPWKQLVRDVDYKLNRGTGDFEIVDPAGLFAGTQVAAKYDYYTNLVAQVQKVLEGDINDPNSFPGVKAAGIHLAVEAPIPRFITVEASISALDGFVETDLVDDVVTVIESYINSRGVGEDVILSKIIDVAHNINGVRDIFVNLPASNVTILENQLPIAGDISIL
jgi:uncharacterized phage protein gp47/JayE